MALRGIDKLSIAIGARITERRVLANINQTELGDVIGVTYQQMQKYERGENRLSIPHAARIAARLGMTLDDLVVEAFEDAERIIVPPLSAPVAKIASRLEKLAAGDTSDIVLSTVGAMIDGFEKTGNRS